MRAIRDPDPETELVRAARAGDPEALDDLLTQYLPLIYNIVGRALSGHADTDDVVQETMLRAVRGIADVRDPAAFRSWLVAVAVRQVRDHTACRPLQLVTDAVPDVPDPGADFVDLTILRLGLSGQRRETAEATRWLDAEDQDALALWWQEAAGMLDREEVAAGLGMSVAHAAVRISRMKERLATARVVVRALGARPGCGALAEVTQDWDRGPSPLWRKRLARHTRDCPRCQSCQSGMIPAEQLLNGLPLIAVPGAAAQLLAALRRGTGPASTSGGRHAAPGRGSGHHGGVHPGAAQHAAAHHSAVHHSAVHHSAVHHGAVHHGAVHAGVTGPDLVNHGASAAGLALRLQQWVLDRVPGLPDVGSLTLQPKAIMAAVAATTCVAGGAVAVAAHDRPRHVPVEAVAVQSPSARPGGSGAGAPGTRHSAAGPPGALPPVHTGSHLPLPSPPADELRDAGPGPRHPGGSGAAGGPGLPPAAAAPGPTLKGVAAWSFSGATQALAMSGASWYYTWSAAPAVTAPPGVEFVPQIWGSASVTPGTLAQARDSGSRDLLTFNEPDLSAQADMTVAQALADWPQLEATGMALGSPAVAAGAATPGGWLDQFMSGARARGYRVDFIDLHWYAQDFDASASVSELKAYLQAVWQRYHLPVWVTELGMARFGSPTAYPADAEQTAFLSGAAAMMAGLGYVQRWAWFALPVRPGSSGDGNLGLFATGPAITSEGRAFQAAAGA